MNALSVAGSPRWRIRRRGCNLGAFFLLLPPSLVGSEASCDYFYAQGSRSVTGALFSGWSGRSDWRVLDSRRTARGRSWQDLCAKKTRARCALSIPSRIVRAAKPMGDIAPSGMPLYLSGPRFRSKLVSSIPHSRYFKPPLPTSPRSLIYSRLTVYFLDTTPCERRLYEPDYQWPPS
jgi:hypothetical protein